MKIFTPVRTAALTNKLALPLLLTPLLLAGCSGESLQPNGYDAHRVTALHTPLPEHCTLPEYSVILHPTWVPVSVMSPSTETNEPNQTGLVQILRCVANCECGIREGAPWTH